MCEIKLISLHSSIRLFFVIAATFLVKCLENKKSNIVTLNEVCFLMFLQPSLNPEAGKQNSQCKPLGTPSGVWGRY